MKLLKLSILFLVLNFGALAIGSWLMASGPQTEWYANLNKAPWTPPGWVFGAAWTTIMIFFSIYMAALYSKRSTTKVVLLFTVQFVLNIIWNFIFFNQHLIGLGLFTIILLTAIVLIFLVDYKETLGLKSFLILPYFVWLCIATSLNMYILIHN
ncbi:TspO/MBR family protein [Algibacter mikhailovii]|uniref:Sensory protein n=1 Tax=Algibacter mikhailovii TaxID=425498 RepID=A0A918VEH8_9FLAO|nr:TspO/MBR family protein [Algibacter mikhailovii]GGZ90799.1 sensory protein [Algibacter mikhailovii]